MFVMNAVLIVELYLFFVDGRNGRESYADELSKYNWSGTVFPNQLSNIQIYCNSTFS